MKGHDQHRGLAHRRCGRAVLDELKELGAQHYPARGGRQIPAELEGGLVGQADVEVIGAALQIFGQERKAAHQILAVGLQGELEQLRVGGQEAAGSHGADVLAGEKRSRSRLFSGTPSRASTAASRCLAVSR